MKKVNSLQVMVPFKRCINNCKFCISYTNCVSVDAKIIEFCDNLKDIFVNKLSFLNSTGCNNIVITGDNEPLMNEDFLLFFSSVLRASTCKFKNIELQTSGVLLNKDVLYFLRNNLKINFVNLSISSLDINVNSEIMGIRRDLIYDFKKMSNEIHDSRMQLRITIILTEWFNKYQNNIAALINDILSIFSPEQITFKKLISVKKMSSTYEWIEKHSASENTAKVY